MISNKKLLYKVTLKVIKLSCIYRIFYFILILVLAAEKFTTLSLNFFGEIAKNMLNVND